MTIHDGSNLKTQNPKLVLCVGCGVVSVQANCQGLDPGSSVHRDRDVVKQTTLIAGGAVLWLVLDRDQGDLRSDSLVHHPRDNPGSFVWDLGTTRANLWGTCASWLENVTKGRWGRICRYRAKTGLNSRPRDSCTRCALVVPVSTEHDNPGDHSYFRSDGPSQASYRIRLQTIVYLLIVVSEPGVPASRQ